MTETQILKNIFQASGDLILDDTPLCLTDLTCGDLSFRCWVDTYSCKVQISSEPLD